MADQGDVESALAAIVANALYPDGTAAESAYRHPHAEYIEAIPHRHPWTQILRTAS